MNIEYSKNNKFYKIIYPNIEQQYRFCDKEFATVHGIILYNWVIKYFTKSIKGFWVKNIHHSHIFSVAKQN